MISIRLYQKIPGPLLVRIDIPAIYPYNEYVVKRHIGCAFSQLVFFCQPSPLRSITCSREAAIQSQSEIIQSIPLREPTLFILLSLAPAPAHGYAIMKEVHNLSKGRVKLVKVDAKQASKVCKVVDKKAAPKGEIQLVLHDGKSITLKKTGLKVGDSVKISLPDQKVQEEISLAEGQMLR